jgi:hypothetical protein
VYESSAGEQVHQPDTRLRRLQVMHPTLGRTKGRGMRNVFARRRQREPELPPFPSKPEEFKGLLVAYARQQRPMDLFFEFYIMEVIGQLPAESLAALDSFAAQNPKLVADGEWKAMVRRDLRLSETIDIAILDLWYRNSEIAGQQGITYHPWHYAINFSENYLAEDSQVDVWPDGALEAAKARIAEHTG